MTVDDYARVARECIKLGTLNFSFQGGEPLLFKSLEPIISACQPERNVISVTTNGTLLNQERVLALKRQGVDILTISLDSAIAEEHDRFRGTPGTFKETMAGIELALKEGLRVTLGAVVTHQTLKSEGVTGLVDLAQKLRVLLYFIWPVPAGRWASKQEMLLTPEDLDYIDEMARNSPYLRTDFHANLGPYGCGAVKEILYLTPYGDVLACPFMHISLGNVFEESVTAIRNRALQNPYFAAYHQKCLVSTDPEFMEKYLSKTFDAKQLPIPWQDVFPPEGGE
jgi:MoaA/NifB/PqqE/SkfB family radical SAM enzyme